MRKRRMAQRGAEGIGRRGDRKIRCRYNPSSTPALVDDIGMTAGNGGNAGSSLQAWRGILVGYMPLRWVLQLAATHCSPLQLPLHA